MFIKKKYNITVSNKSVNDFNNHPLNSVLTGKRLAVVVVREGGPIDGGPPAEALVDLVDAVDTFREVEPPCTGQLSDTKIRFPNGIINPMRLSL